MQVKYRILLIITLSIVITVLGVIFKRNKSILNKPCIDNRRQGICKPLTKCVSPVKTFMEQPFQTFCGSQNGIVYACCLNSSISEETEVNNINDVWKNIYNINNITNILKEINRKDSCNNNDTNGNCRYPPTSTNELINITSNNIISNISNGTNSTRIPGEISKAKCKEYSKYAYRQITSPILSLKPQHEKLYECHDNVEIPIIGKRTVPRKEVPHMVLLGNPTNSRRILYMCGGTLISEHFVLTTADCLFGPIAHDPMYVLLGVIDANSRAYRQIIMIQEPIHHPKYPGGKEIHNVGLARLLHPAQINEFVRPACINTIRDIHYKTAVEYEWGLHVVFNNSRGIAKSVVDILPQESCPKENNDFLICTAPANTQRNDPCMNFPGSTLVIVDHISEKRRCMPLIIGITMTAGNCGRQKSYIRISEYIDWIEKVVWPKGF